MSEEPVEPVPFRRSSFFGAVSDANALLYHATMRGRDVPAEVRDPIVNAFEAVDHEEEVDAERDAAFLAAYAHLAAMALGTGAHLLCPESVLVFRRPRHRFARRNRRGRVPPRADPNGGERLDFSHASSSP
jgi:hypothetical protein